MIIILKDLLDKNSIHQMVEDLGRNKRDQACNRTRLK